MFLGIDIGTSSSKGALVTADGTVIAKAERAHGVSTPYPGWVEQDAESVWWSDFVAIVRELLDTGTPLDGLAVSGIGPCLLPTDALGTPLRPGILYGIDTRATAEVAELNSEFGADAILARGGSPLTSQALGPRLRWLARHEPQVYADTKMLLMASSFLVYRLTGRYVLDHQSASQCNPMYDLRRREWAADWTEIVAPGLTLPTLCWPTEVVGHVTASAAAATGLPAGLPVTAGAIDAAAEATSVGVFAPGDTMIMYGTTMFLMQVIRDPCPHPGLWGVAGTWPDTYMLSGGMATSGAVTDWLRRLVGGQFGDLVAEAAEVPAGSRGLLVLPYFAGERTPLFDPDARGMIAGLTTLHGRAELYRAVLEGIAYGVRHNLEAMAEAGGQTTRLVTVGGGTKGGLWTEIVSDVTGLPQQRPTDTIGACLGDARLAAEAVGVDTSGWNPIAHTVVPDQARTEMYAPYYERYRALHDSTVDIAHFLATEQRRAASVDRFDLKTAAPPPGIRTAVPRNSSTLALTVATAEGKSSSDKEGCMNVTVTLANADTDQLRSLYGDLTREFELRGKVQLSQQALVPGTLGSVPEALVVALGQDGVGVVLASAVVTWVRSRASDIVCKFTRSDGTIAEVSARRLRGCDVAGLQQVIRELSTSLEDQDRQGNDNDSTQAGTRQAP